MIAVQYFLQFYPPMLYEAQKILATIVETAWEARGRMIIEPGWTGFAAEEDDEDAKKKEAEQSLPSVGNNDAVLCADVDALKKKTTPPSRFSEGSLIEAMASIHRFVSDAKAKAVLKEMRASGRKRHGRVSLKPSRVVGSSQPAANPLCPRRSASPSST